jgi:hypothetical protein
LYEISGLVKLGYCAGSNVPSVVGRILRRIERAFRGRPAEIPACRADVDLLPGVLADLVDEESPRGNVPVAGERIA